MAVIIPHKKINKFFTKNKRYIFISQTKDIFLYPKQKENNIGQSIFFGFRVDYSHIKKE